MHEVLRMCMQNVSKPCESVCELREGGEGRETREDERREEGGKRIDFNPEVWNLMKKDNEYIEQVFKLMKNTDYSWEVFKYIKSLR